MSINDSKVHEDSTSSQRFCATDHDVVLISTDRVAFNFYRKNINVHSDGLLERIDADAPSAGVKTFLVEETSGTLDLLLQFMLSQAPPSLERTPFSDVLALAVAAQKYHVYSAIRPCEEFLQLMLPIFPLEIFPYAAEYGNMKLADRIAPLLVVLDEREVIDALLVNSTDSVAYWTCYRESWTALYTSACRSLDIALRDMINLGECSHTSALEKIAIEAGGQIVSLKKWEAYVEESLQTPCSHSRSLDLRLQGWWSTIKKEKDALPMFSAYYVRSTPTPSNNDGNQRHDIILESCDGVQFPFSRDHLTVHSATFAAGNAFSAGAGDTEATPEVVQLTETSRTIELLLQYMSKRPQPELDKLPFRDLAPLAEAAEKYEVYVAIPPCKQRMLLAFEKQPFPVMAYAARHGYHDVADRAAQAALSKGARDLSSLATLPPHLVRAWTRYRQGWASVLQRAHNMLGIWAERDAKSRPVHAYHMSCLADRRSAKHTVSTIALQLGGTYSSLLRLDSICEFVTAHAAIWNGNGWYTEGYCPACVEEVVKWKNEVTVLVGRIPTFSSFL
ncbi:hypothetical protein PLICRDRAFT_155756 [Plicaturopsis crispa FD-325 SS-3]|nr:hypothetical protein PLICRDRAFT_155756 [Plicaturopsis crispa FD-325 SS-3]